MRLKISLLLLRGHTHRKAVLTEVGDAAIQRTAVSAAVPLVSGPTIAFIPTTRTSTSVPTTSATSAATTSAAHQQKGPPLRTRTGDGHCHRRPRLHRLRPGKGVGVFDHQAGIAQVTQLKADCSGRLTATSGLVDSQLVAAGDVRLMGRRSAAHHQLLLLLMIISDGHLL